MGETLWDVLPNGEFLGGAPLNVAGHMARLGTPVALLSRVGTDARGRRALQQLNELGIDLTLMQVDPELPTGEARAVLDHAGSAAYAFLQPAAWDHLESAAHAVEVARAAPALIYGTLAQRSPASRDVIRRLLSVGRWRVLDLNLRAPHDDADTALSSLAFADFVKLNDDELVVLAGWLGVEAARDAVREALALRYGVRTLCITQGARGAVLWHDGGWTEQPAVPTSVADTVGAGDSFLAMLLSRLLQGATPERAMTDAARLAAFVASRSGAIPTYSAEQFSGS